MFNVYLFDPLSSYLFLSIDFFIVLGLHYNSINKQSFEEPLIKCSIGQGWCSFSSLECMSLLWWSYLNSPFFLWECTDKRLLEIYLNVCWTSILSILLFTTGITGWHTKKKARWACFSLTILGRIQSLWETFFLYRPKRRPPDVLQRSFETP